MRLGDILIGETIRSCNVTNSENDYFPYGFDGAEERAPKVRHPSTPVIVTCYREDRGNFIHAAKYL